MSALSEAKSLLEADSTLTTAATGGIYDYDETGRLGLNRTTTPDVFDSNGLIKPTVLLKLRSSNPDYLLADSADKYVSVREVLEVWFYEDSGYANIETMRNRVWALLHETQLAGTFRVFWQGDVRGQRDIELDANVERSDYLVHTKRSA